MRTDQLGQRVWISLKLAALRVRWNALQLLGYAALGIVLLGGYALLERYWPRLDAVIDLQSALPLALGNHWLVAEQMGNVVLIAAGAVAVWALTSQNR